MSGICDTWSEYYDERTRTYSIPCEALFQGCGDESESNYEKLFGTPERAAWTLAHNAPSTCDECVLIDICDIGMPATCMVDDYDALLEWLRGGSDE